MSNIPKVMEYRFYISEKNAKKLLKTWFSHANDILNSGYCTVLQYEQEDFIRQLFELDIPFRKLTLYY